jgi:hypothetical protein
MASKVREIRVRLTQDYPGSLWPNGKCGEIYPEWINIAALKEMLRDTGGGFQIIDWTDDDIYVDTTTKHIAIVQIVEQREAA